MSDLLTAKELADLLSLRLEAVWQYTRDGQIPAYRVGRSYRYNPDEVLAKLRQPEVGKVNPDQTGKGQVREVKAPYEVRPLFLPNEKAAREFVGHAHTKTGDVDVSARISHYMYETFLHQNPGHRERDPEK